VLRVLAESGIDGGSSFTVEEAREHLARIRQWPNFRLFVVWVDGEIAGTYSLVIMDKLGKRGTPRAWWKMWRCRRRCRDRGVGRAMMEHAIGECRKAGCYKLALSSNVKRGPAHKFYESLGFERHGFSFAVFF
jgi:GNAT superfamily N-acetyltransferase